MRSYLTVLIGAAFLCHVAVSHALTVQLTPDDAIGESTKTTVAPESDAAIETRSAEELDPLPVKVLRKRDLYSAIRSQSTRSDQSNTALIEVKYLNYVRDILKRGMTLIIDIVKALSDLDKNEALPQLIEQLESARDAVVHELDNWIFERIPKPAGAAQIMRSLTPSGGQPTLADIYKWIVKSVVPKMREFMEIMKPKTDVMIGKLLGQHGFPQIISPFRPPVDINLSNAPPRQHNDGSDDIFSPPEGEDYQFGMGVRDDDIVTPGPKI